MSQKAIYDVFLTHHSVVEGVADSIYPMGTGIILTAGIRYLIYCKTDVLVPTDNRVGLWIGQSPNIAK